MEFIWCDFQCGLSNDDFKKTSYNISHIQMAFFQYECVYGFQKKLHGQLNMSINHIYISLQTFCQDVSTKCEFSMFLHKQTFFDMLPICNGFL